MRFLVYEIHVTVKWGNILLSDVICRDDTQHVVRCTRDTWCTAGVSCDQMIVAYTQYEYCNMLSSLSTCSNQSGTAASEYALCYPG
jgi:hypothetical protein